VVGESTTISVTIKNQGGPLSCGPNPEDFNNFNVDLYIDPPFLPIVNYHQIVITGTLPWGVQCFSVPPGESFVLITTWEFTDTKTFEVWAQVDSDGNVNEANENNNTNRVNVSVEPAEAFFHDTHQDFLANFASTLENDDATGKLRLGRFEEPPFFGRPFVDGSCAINTSSVTITDVNMITPDTRVNQAISGPQVTPRLFADGQGTVIAVWEDGREGAPPNSDVYLRYSTDYGFSWNNEQRVNDDNSVNAKNPVAALNSAGRFMVVWQDQRNGNSDIFYQEYQLSGSSLIAQGTNQLVGGAASYNEGDQLAPDLAVDDSGGFHVVWQDNRNNNPDIFASSYITQTVNSTDIVTWTLVRRVDDGTTKGLAAAALSAQTSPRIEAADWFRVTDIVYEIVEVGPDEYNVVVSEVISESATFLAVTWTDDRNGDTDIALVVSLDRGETYDIDQLITNSDSDGSQQHPDVTATSGSVIQEISFPVPGLVDTTVSAEVELPVIDLHVVWDGYSTSENMPGDTDVFYSRSRLSVEQRTGGTTEFRPVLAVGGTEKINQNDERDWQSGPVEQSHPAVTRAACANSSDEDPTLNVFIAWADGRNYDDANYDIYYDLKSDCGATLGGNQMLANGVRLHNFDPANPKWAGEYSSGEPPPGFQFRPSVAADIQMEGLTVFTGYLYLAWEDDRVDDSRQEKDIFFARSNLTYANQPPYNIFKDGAGSQISNILDSGTDQTVWYTLDWTVTTPDSTYMTVQTRLGDTITDVLNSEWYPQRFPFQPQKFDCDALVSGAPIPGYDSPGQYIEDAAGEIKPQARYIQYRINFYSRDETNSPELDNITLFYHPEVLNGSNGGNGGPPSGSVFLPIILK
jgi:hypothetical protein